LHFHSVKLFIGHFAQGVSQIFNVIDGVILVLPPEYLVDRNIFQICYAFRVFPPHRLIQLSELFLYVVLLVFNTVLCFEIFLDVQVLYLLLLFFVLVFHVDFVLAQGL